MVPDSRGILAWFDNGDPFMIERFIGSKGGLASASMTSAWNPFESQLALSTKFVPLIERIMRRKDEVVVESQYAVNDAIAASWSTGTLRTRLAPSRSRAARPSPLLPQPRHLVVPTLLAFIT